eukprot:941054-Pyramimonas_sp.AAC.1
MPTLVALGNQAYVLGQRNPGAGCLAKGFQAYCERLRPTVRGYLFLTTAIVRMTVVMMMLIMMMMRLIVMLEIMMLMMMIK